MMKSWISIFLAVILSCTFCSGCMLGVGSILSQRDTKVASTVNDRYEQYRNAGNSADRETAVKASQEYVNSLGGYMETYASEAEYEKARQKRSEGSKKAAISFVSEEIKSVRQTVTVMTTPTGSNEHGNYVESKPIANAIVRIDGVPRYTNRQGQVTVTLSRAYVELYVEKNDYSPYVEIMDVTGEEKIVSLKKPADNIDVYAAMLSYEGEDYNVLTQTCHINEDINDSYYAELTVGCNVPAEKYYILVNGEKTYYSSENVFYDIKFDRLKPHDQLSVVAVYHGVESAPVRTLISIENLEALYAEESVSKDNQSFDPGFDDGLGIFGGVNFNFSDLIEIKNLIKPSRSPSGNLPDLSVTYNNRKGILHISVGYSVNKYIDNDKKGPDGLTDQQRYDLAVSQIDSYNQENEKTHAQITSYQTELKNSYKRLDELQSSGSQNSFKEIERVKKSIATFESQITEAKNSGKNYHYLNEMNRKKREVLDKVDKNTLAKFDQVADLTNSVNERKKSLADYKKELESIPGLVKSARDGYKQHDRGLTIGFEISGVFEYNVRENRVAKVALSVTASIGYKFQGTFMVWVIPCFYEVGVNFSATVGLQFYDEKAGWLSWDALLENFFTKASVTLRGEAGIGFNDVISFSLFAEGSIGFSLYPFAKDDNDAYYIENLFEKCGWSVGYKVGMRAEFLIWDTEVAYNGEGIEIDPKLPLNGAYASAVNNSVKLMNRSVYSGALESSGQKFHSVYQGSKPQLNQVGSRYVLSWIEDSEGRDAYNRTTLKYAVYENGVWEEPQSVWDDGKADFYHDTYFDGKDLYLTWQKSNRLFTEQDDYLAAACAGEIYVAKYNAVSGSFENVNRLTDNAEMDFAPKFALKEGEGDPLTIVWQKNSENDLFGISGTNCIYSASYEGGMWKSPVLRYESNQYFSFVNSAYKDGKLSVSCVLSENGKVADSEGKKICITTEGSSKFISAGDRYITNPQFCLKDGKTVLFYYCDEEIVFTEDFTTVRKFKKMQKGIVADGFKIVDTDDGFAFLYNKTDGEYSQAYCTLYNGNTDDWTYDIKLTNETNKVFGSCGFVTAEGKIVAAHNLQDKACNTSLCFTEKELRSDFEIQNAFFDTSTRQGEKICLTVGIQNTGDTNLQHFKIHAFGQTAEVTSDQPIGIGKYDFISAEFDFLMKAEKEDIILTAKGITKSYILQVAYSDLQLTGRIELVQTDRQMILLSVVNRGDIPTNFVLRVLKGEVLLYEEGFSTDAGTDITKSLELEGLAKGDCLYVEIIPEVKDRLGNDNRILLTSLTDTTIIKEKVNPYSDIMSIAKGVMI